MSITDFINQPLIKKKKYPVGFEGDRFTTQENIHVSLNIEENLHYFGTAADTDSISMQVGLFHPYHPEENCLPCTMGFPQTPIVFECPSECTNNLPIQIKQLLEEYKVPLNKIHIRPFFQNMPWSKGDLLIRPHHIIFKSDTVEVKERFKNGSFSGSAGCRMAIYSCDNKIIIDRTPPESLTPVMHFTSHPSGSGYTLCSPSGYGIIHGVDYTKTCSLYSLIVTINSRNTMDEWYISPVCLLNAQDFQRILKITSDDNIVTLLDVVNALNKEKMADVLTELLGITSPKE